MGVDLSRRIQPQQTLFKTQTSVGYIHPCISNVICEKSAFPALEGRPFLVRFLGAQKMNRRKTIEEMLFKESTMTFKPHHIDEHIPSAYGMTVTDLNNNGHLDIAVTGMSTGNVRWYENVFK